MTSRSSTGNATCRTPSGSSFCRSRTGWPQVGRASASGSPRAGLTCAWCRSPARPRGVFVLDDPRALQRATEAYRAAATTAGLAWPDAVPGGARVPDAVYRIFDVDHVAEQLAWFNSHEGWPMQRLFPD